MSDAQPNAEKSEAGRGRPPYWIFPSLIFSTVIFTVGIFWFCTVVLNQLSSSNKPIDLNYVPAKELARASGSKEATAPDAYIKAGQYQKAINLLEPSIRVLRTTGKEDGLLADNLQAVGKCYLMLKNYYQAEGYYREALAIYDKLGNSYPRKLRKEAEHDYASVLKHLGQTERAKQFETKED